MFILFGAFLSDGLGLTKEAKIAPAIIPQITERKITIARDASNFQKKNVIATGDAFCTENIATIVNTTTNRIIVAIGMSFLVVLKILNHFLDFPLDMPFVFPSSLAI